MITVINSKKIVLKFFISLILSLTITFLNEGMPDKKFSEYKISASLNENIRLLILLLPADKRHSLGTILLSEQNALSHKFESNPNTVKECSIATVNNEKIISSKINPYSLNLVFVINENFNETNCDKAITYQLNEMLKLFFQSLLQDQIKIYQDNLNLIENSENDKSKVIDQILNEIKKENNKNININLLQSNVMDTKNLAGQKNIIDTMKSILKIKDSFYIYGEKIIVKKTYPVYVFLFCFVVIFIILNYSLFLKSFRKFIK